MGKNFRNRYHEIGRLFVISRNELDLLKSEVTP